MKTHALLLALLTALCPPPSYSQSPEGAKGTFTITPTYVSSQTFRGVHEGEMSFQPTLGYSKGSLALELFGNFPLTDEIHAPDPVEHEIDLTGRYRWDILPGAFAIESAVALYAFPRLMNEDGAYKYQIEPNLSFIYSIGRIDFVGTYYYDFVIKGPTYEAGIDCSLPIKDFGFEIAGSARIGRYDWSDTAPNTPSKVRNSGDYFKAGISLQYELPKSATLNLGWYYEKGTSNYIQVGHSRKLPDPGAISYGYLSVALAYSF
jgi:hypothetical protein